LRIVRLQDSAGIWSRFFYDTLTSRLKSPYI
jgi:hypothetical protein